MVEMGMCQQNKIDGRRVEPEGFGIFVIEFAASLTHAAIDQDALAETFDQMTGTRHVTGCAVKGELHGLRAPRVSKGSPFASYQRRMLCHVSSAELASGSMTPSSTRKSASNAFFQ